MPVPGAGWALQKPRGSSGCGGCRGRHREREKCTWGRNTQNLRHQTDKEVAIWGQRDTEEAPREASRHTSQSSSTRLAHSDHSANTFCQEWRDEDVSRAQTHSSRRHVDLEDRDRTVRLHRVQRNPGDRGVTWELTGQVCLSHKGWSGPRQNGNKVCDFRETGASLPFPQVGGHTLGVHPVMVPGH